MQRQRIGLLTILFWSLAIVAGATGQEGQGTNRNPTPRFSATTTPTAQRIPQVGDMLTFRTAGQPERRVCIIRISGTADDGLVDVEDQTTGAKYAVPLKVVVMMMNQPTTSTTKPTRPLLSQPTTPNPPLVVTPNPSAMNQAPQWNAAKSTKHETIAPRSLLPTPQQSKQLMNDTQPAYAALPPLVRPSSPNALASESEADDVQFRPAAIASRMLTQPSEPPVVSTPPAAILQPVDHSASALVSSTLVPPPAFVPVPVPDTVPNAVPNEPMPLTPVQPKNSMVKAPTLTIAAPEYVPVPVYDFGTTTSTPAPREEATSVATAPVAPAIEPVPAPSSMVTHTLEPAAPAAAPQLTATLPNLVAPPRPGPHIIEEYVPVIQQASLVSTTTVQSVNHDLIPWDTFVKLPEAMQHEIRPYLIDLVNALRPSIRERAATALAEGRYGSRPEVKAALARAALLDPAPSVKAHCIRLLSNLGYHETSYLEYLAACTESKHLQLQQSALQAMYKLQPR